MFQMLRRRKNCQWGDWKFSTEAMLAKYKSAILVGRATKTVFASLIEILDLAKWKEVIPNG